MAETGTWIQEGRKRLGLSQAALAARVNSNQAYVSQWETGKRMPSPSEMAALKALLGEAENAQSSLPIVTPISTEEWEAAAPKRGRPRAAKAPGDATPKAPDAKAAANAHLGFEEKLWQAADLLRNNMDPAEYKHVVLGLLFLKYIDDAFEERRAALTAAVADPASDYYVPDSDERQAELADLLEDRDEYTSKNVFWVPLVARWATIQASAKRTEIEIDDHGTKRRVNIGGLLDHAMESIEKDNLPLKGVLPKGYAAPNLDKHNLGKLIDLVSGIGLGTAEHRARDTLGRVYEYFLSKFASAEGKGGGEFFTPTSVVRLLVQMLEPYRGRVFDPCCGSGGMFVQSLKFIDAHNGRRDAVTIYGQESNYTTWRMARMNLAIRGIETSLGSKAADSFHDDQHPDLRADFILANPPFNVSDWGGERLEKDVRWAFGRPPVGNANFGWVQHFVYHLNPTGTAGFVLANGSMSSQQSGEGEIRRKLVEADLVDCMVALPGQLFYSTQIPVCLWFLTRSKAANGHRDRRGHTLFIDARKLGRMETRVHKVFDPEDIEKVAGTYHAWRSKDGQYQDVAGFCMSASTEVIAGHDFVLTPGRYVGAEDVEDDGEAFADKMAGLVLALEEQMGASTRLDDQIRKALKGLGYGQ